MPHYMRSRKKAKEIHYLIYTEVFAFSLSIFPHFCWLCVLGCFRITIRMKLEVETSFVLSVSVHFLSTTFLFHFNLFRVLQYPCVYCRFCHLCFARKCVWADRRRYSLQHCYSTQKQRNSAKLENVIFPGVHSVLNTFHSFHSIHHPKSRNQFTFHPCSPPLPSSLYNIYVSDFFLEFRSQSNVTISVPLDSNIFKIVQQVQYDFFYNFPYKLFCCCYFSYDIFFVCIFRHCFVDCVS